MIKKSLVAYSAVTIALFMVCGNNNPADSIGPAGATSLVSPDDGALGQFVTPILVWTAADNATAYELEVSTDSTFIYTEVKHITIADTFVSVSDSLSFETRYFWRVRAKNAKGPGAWTQPRSFTTGHEDASITDFRTGFLSGDTALVPTRWYVFGYNCTLSVRLPEYADSIMVKRKKGDSTVLAAALAAADTQRVFNFVSWKFGRDTLVAYLIRKDGAGNDTMLKPFFSPSLYIGVNSICHLNSCPVFDTIFADTCAYDRDSVDDPADIAFSLSWPGDTVRGSSGLYRLVKVYGEYCIYIPAQGTVCFPIWIRRWVVEYDDGVSHSCGDIGSDTLLWSVVNSDQDTVTQALVLRRGTTCP